MTRNEAYKLFKITYLEVMEALNSYLELEALYYDKESEGIYFDRVLELARRNTIAASEYIKVNGKRSIYKQMYDVGQWLEIAAKKHRVVVDRNYI